ncbi:MAG: hypothetical protein HGA37_09880 [Lentimicrobium sp.]|nr:hypothetical protein [Lentimicrobium sp.]
MRSISLILLLSIICASCSKEAGEGGNSSIYGKVIVHNYNSSFTELNDIYDGADEEVYIIYGDDKSYSERIRTSYNGVYEFRYLRQGKYTVFVYSEDSTLTIPSGKYAVIREIEITGNRQTVKADDIIIFK